MSEPRKLSDADKSAIQGDPRDQYAIAADYGVSQQRVSEVVSDSVVLKYRTTRRTRRIVLELSESLCQCGMAEDGTVSEFLRAAVVEKIARERERMADH